MGAASAEQVDAAMAAAGEAFARLGRHPGGRARRAAARGGRAAARAHRRAGARDDRSRAASRSIENTDEVGWTAAAFDYYAEMGRNFAGRVIPPIESTQLALVVKEPIGVVGCIVPWNYPLLLLAWKVAPALGGGQHGRRKALGADAALDADARRLLRAPAARASVNLVAGAGDVGAAIVRRRARRRRRVHRLGGDRQAGRRRVRPARRAHEPRDGRQGPVHRLRRRGRRRAGRRPRRRLGGVPQRRPGVHLGRALLRCARGVRRLRLRVRRLHELAARRRSAGRVAPTSGRWSRRRSARRSRPSVEAAVAAGAELVVGGDRAGFERGHFWRPPS